MIKTILSIEDDRGTQLLNKIYLKESGFCSHMLESWNGHQALSFFEKLSIGEEPMENCPQIILLDINMPLMGGWEFLNHFESRFPQFATSMPIFILSSSINPEDKEKANNDPRVMCMLEKPFDFEQIEIAKRILVQFKVEDVV